MAIIPASIDDVTPAWLGEVLGHEVTGTDIEQIGVGIGVSSALYRVGIVGPESTDRPESVVVKLPALDEAAVFTSTVLRMYIREVGFFGELASRSPIRVPSCHHADVDPETSRFVVVMEDMGGHRTVDQLAGMDIVDAERAVESLADWHATWWRGADGLADAGLVVSLGDPIYPAVLPMVFAEGWAKVTGELDVSSAIAEVGPKFGDAIAGLLADLDREPRTMTHGDYRADNILFQPDGAPVLLDFQLIGSGSGAYDLAYFVTQSLDPEVASTHERALFDRWCDRLRANGVPAGDLARAWDDYRTAALFCLVYPIVASRGMDLADPRQRGLVECMNTRISRAIDELGLAELV
ncbi:MAG TPA: phosphotransferase [Acidimicrobiales bacterium]|nr:phosphotransferase [Acidimicrobiales bacterium]